MGIALIIKEEHRQRMQYTPFKCLSIIILTMMYTFMYLGLELTDKD